MGKRFAIDRWIDMKSKQRHLEADSRACLAKVPKARDGAQEEPKQTHSSFITALLYPLPSLYYPLALLDWPRPVLEMFPEAKSSSGAKLKDRNAIKRKFTPTQFRIRSISLRHIA